MNQTSGATNYRGQILFTGEGQGDDTPPSLFIMNPVEPYNTTGKPLSSTFVKTCLQTPRIYDLVGLSELTLASPFKQFLWSTIQFTQRCGHQSP